ncbi:unnamed protein product [Orchesella dallaii]|uniref:C2H2-type domain-containing protein n=1 Tax=Orchesella dallaii TaxID=48710 RepID=A0ABP1R963_9HEXA
MGSSMDKLMMGVLMQNNLGWITKAEMDKINNYTRPKSDNENSQRVQREQKTRSAAMKKREKNKKKKQKQRNFSTSPTPNGTSTQGENNAGGLVSNSFGLAQNVSMGADDDGKLETQKENENMVVPFENVGQHSTMCQSGTGNEVLSESNKMENNPQLTLLLPIPEQQGEKNLGNTNKQILKSLPVRLAPNSKEEGNPPRMLQSSKGNISFSVAGGEEPQLLILSVGSEWGNETQNPQQNREENISIMIPVIITAWDPILKSSAEQQSSNFQPISQQSPPTRRKHPRKSNPAAIPNNSSLALFEEPTIVVHTVSKLTYTTHAAPRTRTKFKCSHCPAEVTSNKVIRFHLSLHAEGSGSIACPECGWVLLPESLQYHRRRFHLVTSSDYTKFTTPKGTKGYKCHHCTAWYYRRAPMENHVKLHCAESKHIVCPKPDCGWFLSSDGIYSHFRNIHPEHVWECHECHAEFSSSHGLFEHRKHHEKTGILCDRCGLLCEDLERHQNVCFIMSLQF